MEKLDLTQHIRQIRADMAACVIPDTPDTHDARMKELRRVRALRSAESRAVFEECYGHSPEITGA